MLSPVFARTRKIEIDDVLDACRFDTMQLWFICETGEGHKPIGCLVTEIIEFPSRRVARVILGAGEDAMRWRPCIGKLESWAQREGCLSFELIGRKGWARIFPEYEEIERTYSKELG
jgi:hypothetical protein